MKTVLGKKLSKSNKKQKTFTINVNSSSEDSSDSEQEVGSCDRSVEPSGADSDIRLVTYKIISPKIVNQDKNSELNLINTMPMKIVDKNLNSSKDGVVIGT